MANRPRGQGTHTIRCISEDALLVEFGDTLDDRIHEQVRAMDTALRHSAIADQLETLPTFRSLLVKFDPFTLSPRVLVDFVEALDLSLIHI